MLTNRRVMRSISILQTSAAVVGSGDLDHKIEEKGNDEITELARSFNQMTSDLKMVTASKSELEKEVSRRIEAEAELMASNEELQEQARRLEEEIDERKRAEAEIAHLASFPELNPNPVIELSATGTITYANAASKKFFPDLTSLGSQHPFLADAVEAIRKGEAQSLTTDVEFGGAWYLQTLTYVPSTASYRLYASNITARKQAEGQLGRSNAELEAANKELEAFTYSVSHDLREPLRAIDGFSRILLEDYRDRLDAEGQRLLSTIRTGTERMGQLIADLLALSRLGRQHMKSSETDMRKLTQSVWNELASSTEGRKVDVKVDELPAAVCDPSLMQQVMVNLLSNAIKFTRPKEAARIEVRSLITNGESVYYVKDNGVGFDMRYADKLFGIFQRLHSREEFEGTGVGLAIVQRIVHRHGGRVWAESRPGEGATFYFSLPERRPDHERG